MDLSQMQLSISLLRRYLRKNSIDANKIELLKNIIDSFKDYLPISSLPFKPAQLIRVTINKKMIVRKCTQYFVSLGHEI